MELESSLNKPFDYLSYANARIEAALQELDSAVKVYGCV